MVINQILTEFANKEELIKRVSIQQNKNRNLLV